MLLYPLLFDCIVCLAATVYGVVRCFPFFDPLALLHFLVLQALQVFQVYSKYSKYEKCYKQYKFYKPLL